MSWSQSKDDHQWSELSSRYVIKTPIFSLVRSKRVDRENRKGDFFIVEAPEWVTVIPLFENDLENDPENSSGDEFLMVRQYRHGSQAVTVEFPAGIVDPGEDPVDAAVRELKEETGYEAQEIIPIGSVNPNPAFMTNHTHTFLARGLKKVAEQQLDPLERVEYRKVPVAQVFANMGEGEYGNGVMLISLAFFQKWKKGK